jgi:hypothetical protein
MSINSAYYEEPNRKESIAQPQQSLRSLIKIELAERFTAGMVRIDIGKKNIYRNLGID